MPKGEKIFDSGPGALRLQENDKEADYDGGRIVLVADVNSLPKELVKEEDLTNITVLLNYREDKPMEKWPLAREDRARRRFRLTITEEAE